MSWRCWFAHHWTDWRTVRVRRVVNLRGFAAESYLHHEFETRECLQCKVAQERKPL